MPPTHRHIFIAGLHRSGTTLLQRILREHPEISGFRDTGAPEDEGQHLQSVLPGAGKCGGPSRFALNGEAYRKAVAACVTPENREKLFAEWSPHWNLEKPFLLEKSPPNTLRAPYLEALFPPSYFIYIVRHPIPVAFSMAEREWAGSTSIPALMRNWCAGYRYALADMPRLQHSLLIRYEDLTAHPAATLEKIYGFLGVKPLAAAEPVQPSNDKHFEAWEDFSRRHRLQALRIKSLQSHLETFGYSLREPYIQAMEQL